MIYRYNCFFLGYGKLGRSKNYECCFKKYSIGIQREEVKIEFVVEISKYFVFFDFFFKDLRLFFILIVVVLKKKNLFIF